MNIGEKIKVGGIALNETTSLNKVKYTWEEILKAAPSLQGRTIIKDHNPISDNSVGMVEKSTPINNEKKLAFEGWIEEDGTGVTRRVSDGRLKVSIGAMVDQLVQESEDSDVVIAKGISFQELSLTPTPGVAGAFITKKESYDEEYKLTPEDEELIKKAYEEDKEIDTTEKGEENEEDKQETEENKIPENTDNNQEITQTGEIKDEQTQDTIQKSEVEQTEDNKNKININDEVKMEENKNEITSETKAETITETKAIEVPAKAEVVKEEKEAIPENYVYEHFEGELCLYRKPFGRFAK